MISITHTDGSPVSRTSILLPVIGIVQIEIDRRDSRIMRKTNNLQGFYCLCRQSRHIYSLHAVDIPDGGTITLRFDLISRMQLHRTTRGCRVVCGTTAQHG